MNLLADSYMKKGELHRGEETAVKVTFTLFLTSDLFDETHAIFPLQILITFLYSGTMTHCELQSNTSVRRTVCAALYITILDFITKSEGN